MVIEGWTGSGFKFVSLEHARARDASLRPPKDNFQGSFPSLPCVANSPHRARSIGATVTPTGCPPRLPSGSTKLVRRSSYSPPAWPGCCNGTRKGVDWTFTSLYAIRPYRATDKLLGEHPVHGFPLVNRDPINGIRALPDPGRP